MLLAPVFYPYPYRIHTGNMSAGTGIMPGLSRVKGTKERGCIKTRQTQLYPGRYFVIHLYGCDRRNGSRPGGSGDYQQLRQRKPDELDFYGLSPDDGGNDADFR